MGRLLRARAFASDVTFERWDSLAAAHRDAWMEADSPERFRRAVNQGLRSFGISHLTLLPGDAPLPRAPDGAIDLSIVSGCVRNSEHREIAELLRRTSRTVLACGACACR